jgi:diadenosine tetraphosphatase ApaH/serine/threonine PP2A family protein phosphatase
MDWWCRERLTTDDLRWVESWPTMTRIVAEGLGAVVFCHATPSDIEGVITSATPDEDVEREIAVVEAEVVVCGHTHVQFDRLLPNGRRIVNPGSVGLPYERAAGAYWAVIAPAVELRCTRYDTEEALASFEAAAFPDSGPATGWFDGVFRRSLRAEIPPTDATAVFERRRLGITE